MISVFRVTSPRKNPWTCRFKDAEGKLRQRFFPTEAKAKAYARGINRFMAVEQVLPLSSQEREWWRRLSQTAERHGWDMAEAVDACEQTLRARVDQEKIRVEDAVSLFQKDVEDRNLRPKTLAQYRQVLALFAREMSGFYVSEISGKRIADWITRRYQAESSRSTTRTRIIPDRAGSGPPSQRRLPPHSARPRRDGLCRSASL